MKDNADGQKEVYKERIVAQGFQEENAPQADLPEMQRESMKIFVFLQ